MCGVEWSLPSESHWLLGGVGGPRELESLLLAVGRPQKERQQKLKALGACQLPGEHLSVGS